MEFEFALYNGFKLRNFEMSKRFGIYHSINLKNFPNDRGGRYNISNLMDYLKKRQVSYLSRVNIYDSNLYKYCSLIP